MCVLAMFQCTISQNNCYFENVLAEIFLAHTFQIWEVYLSKAASRMLLAVKENIHRNTLILSVTHNIALAATEDKRRAHNGLYRERAYSLQIWRARQEVKVSSLKGENWAGCFVGKPVIGEYKSPIWR